MICVELRYFDLALQDRRLIRFVGDTWEILTDL